MKSARTTYLRTAERIGRDLVDGAIWHRGVCCWVGAEPTELLEPGSEAPRVHRPLDADLYSGTAGIAVFLAELCLRTDLPGSRRTSIGAARHALSSIERVPEQSRLGMFTGWPGIAYACARVGAVLGELELVDRAVELLDRSDGLDVHADGFDLMSGRAGAVLVLLAFHRSRGTQAHLDRAMRLGDELLNSAVVSDVGLSWPSPDTSDGRNLTGLSHGTAGAAHAFLELYAACGSETYNEAAQHCFDYERRWFSERDQNWPDFRRGLRRTRKRDTPRCAVFWCHGAPGIALVAPSELAASRR